MRSLVVTQNCTADGRVEMLDSWFDPQGPDGVDTSDMQAENDRQDAAADALLVGRRTFEDFRGYWRDLPDDATGVSDYLNRVRKYVVSSTLTEPDWAGTTVLSGDLVEEVSALKASEGGDIVCTGSITLSHDLFAAGLVDVVRLNVYPAFQGRGRGLVPDGFSLERCELTRSVAFRSGVVLLEYEIAPTRPKLSGGSAH